MSSLHSRWKNLGYLLKREVFKNLWPYFKTTIQIDSKACVLFSKMVRYSQENMHTVYYLPFHPHPSPQEVLFPSLGLVRFCEDWEPGPITLSPLESPFPALVSQDHRSHGPASAYIVKLLSNPCLYLYHNDLLIWSYYIHLLQKWHKNSLWSPWPYDVLNKSAEPARKFPWMYSLSPSTQSSLHSAHYTDSKIQILSSHILPPNS